MFDQIFYSPQKKQSMITSNRHGICEYSHKLQNELRLRVLGNLEISEKLQNLIEVA